MVNAFLCLGAQKVVLPTRPSVLLAASILLCYHIVQQWTVPLRLYVQCSVTDSAVNLMMYEDMQPLEQSKYIKLVKAFIVLNVTDANYAILRWIAVLQYIANMS